MKRLLFIILLTVSFSYSFAQQKSSAGWVFDKKERSKTITEVKASPNPFYEQTSILFQSNQKQPVIFSVKNLLGKEVYSKRIEARKGRNSIFFHRGSLQKGIYIYSLQSRNEVTIKRLVIR